ncbi:hypothetical protein M9458_044085 [Cirrhinus mrigala]|uniref:TLDc domain-containing protein n=1 Tax=Cirrhinus mrigala TaxID=683832 RepID=A0ABD0NFY3_CIRMR
MDSLASKLTERESEQLCDLLGNVELTLLYKASVHGYKASAFHQQCDHQGPTLLVAFNRSGYIFGGYTSVDYAQSGQAITDKKAFLFNFEEEMLFFIEVKSGHNARFDDNKGPNFGQQLYFCYNNQPVVYHQRGKAFSFDAETLYGNDTELIECEVYKKPWRNILWTADRRAELMEKIRNQKPLTTSVSCFQILMIGPVGAGKSSFFNSINSIFMGRITSKAILTTQFRTYPVKDGRAGKSLPFVLCDTMGLEEQSGAGLDIEDISSILQGHIPDRYKFNPISPFQPDEQKASRQEKIHCVVYVIDATKISLMSDKLQDKLTTIRRKVNSLGNLYVSSYIKTKVSSRLGVSVSCVLPVKNYSQEVELELNCDVLLLTALQQMLNFADDYLDDVCPMEDQPK